MAASVCLTINLRDGSSQTISHDVGGQDNHVVRYSELIRSLIYVQEQSNAVLTTMVNQEKAQKNRLGGSSDVVSDETERKSDGRNGGGNEEETGDEEEEEDSEDDDADKPPLDKKKKT